MTCPARSFSMLSDPSRCESEQWTIKTFGKDCGDPLEHLDLVYFSYYYSGSDRWRMLYNYNNRDIWSGNPFGVHYDDNFMHGERQQFIIFKDGYGNIYDW